MWKLGPGRRSRAFPDLRNRRHAALTPNPAVSIGGTLAHGAPRSPLKGIQLKYTTKHLSVVTHASRKYLKAHRDVAKSSSRLSGESRLSVGVEAQTWAEEAESVERLTSGAVVARARCNLSISSLFTSLFSFFLNYLKCYLSNKEIPKKKQKKEKKNLNLSFLCIMAYVRFFNKKCLCVLSFCAVKRARL